MSQFTNPFFSFSSQDKKENQPTEDSNKPTFSFTGFSGSSYKITDDDSAKRSEKIANLFSAFRAPYPKDETTNSIITPSNDEKKEEKVEVRCSTNFTLSLFSESVIGISETRGNYDKVSIYDISDVSNVKENVISEYLEAGHDKETCGFKNMEVDLESIVLNKIENDSTPRRVRAVCKSFKRSYPVIERAFINDWNPSSLTLKQNLIETGEEECIGFVDQVAVAAVSHSNVAPRLEDLKEGTFQKEEPTLDFSGEEYPALRASSSLMVLLPCENCKERKYSLNAVCYKSRIFLFDLKERKFTKSIKFIDQSLGKQFTLKKFMKNPVYIPYVEGNRLRSFILTEDKKLFEFYWTVQYEELACVEHCTWIGGQISQVIVTDEDFGFIISTFEDKIILYKPGEIGKPYTDGRVKTIQKKHITPSIWCSKSKVLFERSIYYNYEPVNFEKSNLTMDEINQTEEKKVSDVFSYQEYLKELEFSCYNESVDNFTSIKKVKVDGRINGLRSEFIYRIENKKKTTKELEIIAGWNLENCKDCKIPKSAHYKDIELKDLTNYLGAPIIYQGKASKDHKFTTFLDLEHGKRSSKVVKFGDISGKSSSTATNNIEHLEFIGILAPKSII